MVFGVPRDVAPETAAGDVPLGTRLICEAAPETLTVTGSIEVTTVPLSERAEFVSAVALDALGISFVVSPEISPVEIVQVAPRVQVCPLTVVAEFARPALLNAPVILRVSMPPEGLEKAKVSPLKAEGLTKFSNTCEALFDPPV